MPSNTSRSSFCEKEVLEPPDFVLMSGLNPDEDTASTERTLMRVVEGRKIGWQSTRQNASRCPFVLLIISKISAQKVPPKLHQLIKKFPPQKDIPDARKGGDTNGEERRKTIVKKVQKEQNDEPPHRPSKYAKKWEAEITNDDKIKTVAL